MEAPFTEMETSGGVVWGWKSGVGFGPGTYQPCRKILLQISDSLRGGSMHFFTSLSLILLNHRSLQIIDA